MIYREQTSVLSVIFLLCLQGMVACENHSNTVPSSKSDQTVTDAIAVVPKNDVNTPPWIRGITQSTHSSGDIELTVIHEDRELDWVGLNVEFSIDEQLNWRPAQIREAINGQIVAQLSGQTTLMWDSLADISFHETHDIHIRVTPSDTQQGRSGTLLWRGFDNLKMAMQGVDDYVVYYGKITAEEIAQLETYQLTVVHPVANTNLTRQIVADIQDGINPSDPKDDVIVLCYITVGEDGRTVDLTDQQMLADAKFLTQPNALAGPRVDPRGISAYTTEMSLEGISVEGLASPGGTQFASWYLDDGSLATGTADGMPDRNANWGGAYVNVGDPGWYDVLVNMNTVDGDSAGIEQILNADVFKGLGCDGLFLDTLDVASPNAWSSVLKYEWTAPGVNVFLQTLRQDYPRAVLMQNRGLFFFSPEHRHYAYNMTKEIDFLMFESYRLDSSDIVDFMPLHFCGNKRDYAPKLIAESHRPNGFKVVSLGYAEGPANTLSNETLQDTLLGRSDFGLNNLVRDISEAQDTMGFRHYMTNSTLDLLNHFVKNRSIHTDTRAPVWSSTFNDIFCSESIDSTRLPTPRTGIQQVEIQTNSATLRWDVAIDKNMVSYVMYYQTWPFDFASAQPLAGAIRSVLVPQVSANYAMGRLDSAYPFEYTLSGLSNNVTYYFLIRAIDHSSAANEDSNQVVLFATPSF